MIEYIVSLMLYYSNLSQQSINDANEFTIERQKYVDYIIEKRENEKEIDYIEELKKLGYYIEDSENQSINLRNSIIRFQSDYNMNVSGEWTQESMRYLVARLNNNELIHSDKVQNPPSKEKWIAINKTKRILTLYEESKVVKKYPVAVGHPSSLTPNGKHEVVCKVINPDWGGGGYTDPIKGGIPENPLGYRWIGLSIGGGSEYGIHGNNKPYSIGTYASLGCIRMINSDVESMFEIVPISTAVWIGDDEQLREWGVIQE